MSRGARIRWPSVDVTGDVPGAMRKRWPVRRAQPPIVLPMSSPVTEGAGAGPYLLDAERLAATTRRGERNGGGVHRPGVTQRRDHAQVARPRVALAHPSRGPGGFEPRGSSGNSCADD